MMLRIAFKENTAMDYKNHYDKFPDPFSVQTVGLIRLEVAVVGYINH